MAETSLAKGSTSGLGHWFGRDPFRSLQREMDDLLSRFSTDWNGDGNGLQALPSLDLAETDEAYEVKLDVPGVKSDEIDVEVTGNLVRIRGEHREEKEDRGKTWHHVERRSGSFSRALTLPGEVDRDRVEATCRDGILTLTLPKIAAEKARKIAIKG